MTTFNGTSNNDTFIGGNDLFDSQAGIDTVIKNHYIIINRSRGVSLKYWITLPLLGFSSLVLAGSVNPMDVRSISMGGTGVASSKPSTAGIFNPALLSSYREGKKYRFSMVLPNIGIGVFADPDALDTFESLDDDDPLDEINISRENMNNDINFAESRDTLVGQLRRLDSNLHTINGKPLRLNADGLFALAVPSKKVGFGLHATANIVAEVVPTVSACDRQYLKDYANYIAGLDTEQDVDATAALSCGGTQPDRFITQADVLVPGTFALVDPSDTLDSSYFIGAVIVSEVGLAFSHEFEISGHAYDFGITPKLVSVTSQVLLPSLQNLDDEEYDVADELENSKADGDAFNIDLGFATLLLQDETLTVGAVVKNLLVQRYKTAQFIGSNGLPRRESFELEPQLTAGVAWAGPAGLTLASDLDVTPANPYFYGEKTQYWAAGVEWDIGEIFRLRAGTRINLANAGEDRQISFGTGLNIVAVHFDLGGYYSDNNAGIALQAGIEL